MRYLSTRGRAPERSFSEILLEGLASDGGLYVPESYPSFSRHELAEMAKMPYAELALVLLSRFAPEIPEADWARMLLATYHASRYPYARQPIRSARVAPHLARSGAIWCSRAFKRPDARLQRYGDAASWRTL